MNGLELAKAFYEECGAQMLHAQFPDLESRVAVGLCGSGSECCGWDDETSLDHDFSPDFCIFLPDDVDEKSAFALERTYAKLPKEYGGVQRLRLSPVGGNRRGVLRMGDFWEQKTGHRDGNLTLRDWLTLPEHYLLEATNGEIWRDDAGEFSTVRQRLSCLPEDVRLKKLAGHLLLMAQAGQYNFTRCLAHGEPAAAQLAMNEFVQHTLAAIFLLNRRYLPYYKWQFRALRELPRLSELGETLELLLTTDNGSVMARAKADLAEDIASQIISALQDDGLTSAICGDLEKHAYSVNDHVNDPNLRNENILLGV